MYLTSHRIRTDDGEEAINTFLHHTGHPIDHPEQELARVEYDAGELVAAACDRTPGRNHVLCYLDIVAPDEADEAVLTTLRQTARTMLDNEPDTVPFLMTSGAAVMRLGCTIGHHHQKRHLADFDLLWDRSIEVFRKRPRPAWLSSTEPLVILRGQLEEQLVYQLDDASFSRVQALKGPHWKRHRIVVDIFDQMDVERMHDDITPDIATTITGLGHEDLAAMGGVSIRESRTGQELARFP